VAGSIRQITGSAAQVKVLVDEVSVGSQEQSRGIEQIATAVTRMEAVTQRSTASAEQSASASEELAAQAQTLSGIVDRVHQLVGGAPASARPANVPRRPPAPAASSSAGLVALDRSLRAAGNAKRLAPVISSPARETFPLDDSEGKL